MLKKIMLIGGILVLIIIVILYFYKVNIGEDINKPYQDNLDLEIQEQYDCLIIRTFRIVDLLDGYITDDELYSYITNNLNPKNRFGTNSRSYV